MNLCLQAECLRAGPFYFGYEVLTEGETFYLILHTRTYDGIRVESHHATAPVEMTATNINEARAEAADTVKAYAESVSGK